MSIRWVVACITLFATLPAIAQEQQAPVAEATAAARVSVNQVLKSFPDFVCRERITSAVVDKGKTKEQRVVESVFMVQRKTQTRANGTAVYSLVESRELTTIDRKTAAKTASMPTSPLFFDGLAANILFVADVPRYYIPQAENLEGRLTMRIGYTTHDSREFLQLEFPASVSSVQIDAQSKKTFHIESRFGLRYSGSGIPVAADFQSIDIDGSSYWVPRLLKAEAITAKGAALTYVAEYTDCKKFEVSVQIRSVPDAPAQ